MRGPGNIVHPEGVAVRIAVVAGKVQSLGTVFIERNFVRDRDGRVVLRQYAQGKRRTGVQTRKIGRRHGNRYAAAGVRHRLEGERIRAVAVVGNNNAAFVNCQN
ncbi:hypothetical protein SDC9_62728 [bioreactor metagenome]|uniref:Uncharacterized protein n=1 Tax=bioreactor metagenome TaxID=1076179 RepID=A0A644XJJ1_9ZZZZ